MWISKIFSIYAPEIHILNIVNFRTLARAGLKHTRFNLGAFTFCVLTLLTSSTSAQGVPSLSYPSATGYHSSFLSISPSQLDPNGAAINGCAIKTGTQALPRWARLNTRTCVISGTPNILSSPNTFTIRAKNKFGFSSDATIEIQVLPQVPLLVFSNALKTMRKGKAFSLSPLMLKTRGANLSGCDIKAGTTALPAWAAIHPQKCTISGTPTALMPETEFQVVATNSEGDSIESSINIEVVPGPPHLSYAGATGAVVALGSTMSLVPSTLENNGSAITSCEIKTKSRALPVWATLNSSDCSISGNPTELLRPTVYSILAENAEGKSAEAKVTLEVRVGLPELSFASVTGNSGLIGVPMSVNPTTFETRGGALKKCAIKAGTPSLPSWAKISSATCAISGTPNALLSTTTYTLIATNAAGNSDEATINLSVGPNVPALNYAAGTARVGTSYSQSPTLLNGRGAAITACDISSGSPALPSWATLNPTTCVVSGVPDAVLSATAFSIIASNSVGESEPAVLLLEVEAGSPLLSYAGASGTSGLVSEAMSISPTTLNDQGSPISGCSVKFATKELPTWASIDPSTCVISGTPTAPMIATTYLIRATNAAGYGAASTAAVSITVQSSGSIVVSSGNNQSGVAGAVLSSQFVAVIKNTAGTPLNNVAVNWAVTGGGGSLSSCTSTSNASGLVSCTLTLGTIAGTNSVSVSATGIGTPAIFTASSVAGAPASISINSGSNQSATVNTALSSNLLAIVKDAYNNVVSGATVSWDVTAGGGSLSSCTTTSSAGGLVSCSLTTGLSAGTNTVTASLSGVATPATFTATGTAGAPSSIVVSSGNNQSGTAGVTLGSSLVSIVKDVYDNVVSGVSVSWAVTAGGGTLPTCTSSTNASGLSSCSFITGTTAGTNTVTASVAGIATPATFTATGTAGAPSSIAVNSGNNQSAVAGATLASIIVAIVKDANDNVVSGVTVSWAVTAGGGSLSSCTTTSSASGLVSCSLSTGTTAGTNTVTASVAGIATPATFTATGTAGPLNNFLLSSVPASATAGNSFNFTVTARDVNNNVKSDYTGTVQFSSSDVNSPTLPANYTFLGGDAGIKQFSFTLKTSGNQTITVASTVDGSPNATTSNISVSANTATQLAIIDGPANRAAGAALPTLLVRALDAYGNTATSYSGDISFVILNNPSGGTLSGTTLVAATSGASSFAGLSIDKTGAAYTLQAQGTGGVSSANSLSFNITGDRLSITTQPISTKTGTTMANVVVKVVDALDVVDTSFSGNITIAAASNPNSATLSGTLTVAAVNGVATFSTLSLNKVGAAMTLSATSTGLTGATSNTFNSTADRLTFTTQPANSPVNSSIPSVVVKATDAFSNVDTSFTSNVAMAISTNPNSGVLSGTTSVAALAGVATFSNLSIDKLGAGYRITASSTDLTSAVSDTFNLTADRLIVFTQPSASTKAATNMASSVVIRATDSAGNIDSNFTANVTLALGVNPNSGTLSAGSGLTVAAVAGVATFTTLQVNKVGTGYTITAAATGLSGATSNTFTITADRLTFSTQPSNSISSTPIAPAVVVRATDSFGNVDTAFASNITVAIGTNPASGTLSGTTVVAASSGTSTYSNLSINNAGTGYTLTAAASGLTGATSNAFNITACSTTYSSGSTNITNGSTHAILCVTGSATVTIPAGITTTIDTLIVNGATANVILNKSHTFQTVNVAQGTLTSAAFDNAFSGASWTSTPGIGNGKLVFTTGTLTVGAAGIISMNSKGYHGGITGRQQGGSPTGPGASSGAANGGGGGGGTGYPGQGGAYGTQGSTQDSGNSYYSKGITYGANDFTTELYLGSGGGSGNGAAGGSGGGAISINATNINLASGAQIISKGTNGGTWAGGGSGGTIVLNTTTFTNSGATISVAGGTSNSGPVHGGFGRIFITPSALIDGSNNVTLSGIVGYQHNLIASNAINTYTLAGGSIVYLTKDAGASISTLTISGSSTLNLDSDFTFGTVNVTSGTLTSSEFNNGFSGASWTSTPGIGNGKLVFTTGTLTVGAAGIISMNSKGYQGGIVGRQQGGSPTGPGASSGAANGGGGGGGTGYPGQGGAYGTQGSTPTTNANTYTRGLPYGASDFTTELYLGSGGGSGNGDAGGSGGGAISINATNINLASGAQIISKGTNGGTWAGGGSGGTIVLNTTTFTNSGATISVAGGTSNSGPVHGGFGRIFITPSALIDGSNNVTLSGIVGYQHNLIASNAINTYTLAGGSIVYLTKDAGASISTLSLTASSTLHLDSEFTFNTVNVTSGTLTSSEFNNGFSGASWTSTPGIGNGKLVFTTGTLTVGAAGIISMNSKGYQGGIVGRQQGGSPTGPGASSGAANGGGGGGGTGYPGQGGAYGTQGSTPTTNSSNYSKGFTYGASDFTTELYLGSGGGSGNGAAGGSGGGAISINATNINLASGAQIISKGTNGGTWAGGGSGGTIVLNSTNFANSGATISTTGGISNSGPVHGGFGRLAMSYDNCTDSFCPHLGQGAGSQYVPRFSYAVQCTLSNSTYSCTADTTSVSQPTAISLVTPASSPGNLRTPTFQVSGGPSWVQGRIVKIYSDSSCTVSRGAANIGAGATQNVTSSPLDTDGSYLFYATIVSEQGFESPCSTAAAAYVLQTTPSNVPVLTSNTVSPNTISQPVFNVSIQGGGNFAVDDVLTLHEGADCLAAAVSTQAIPGAISSTTTSRSNAMNEGITNFRAKITNAAGNSACSNAVVYRYDNTLPSWSSMPAVAENENPFNSTTTSPSIAFTANASDSGSGVSFYEYAIGSGNTGAAASDIKGWTTIGSSPFSASGLSLNHSYRYYINMRAVDNAGLRSTVNSDSWVVDTNAAASISVVAAYPTNGAKWNDYVKNDGADIISGTDTTCAGTESNRTDCAHGGELRKAIIAAESSCSGLSIRDFRGVFNWACKIESSQVVVYSTGIKATKNMRDLINFATPAWLTNYVIVTGGVANTTYQSTAAVWWTNDFAVLPDNSADAGTSQSLSVASRIYTLATSRATSGGYSLTADKVSIVGAAGASLTWNGNSSATTTTCGSRSLVCLSGRKFVWADIDVIGGSGSNKGQYGYFITGTSFSRIGSPNISGMILNGLHIVSSTTKSLFGNVNSSNNTATASGVNINASNNNTFGNFTANSNGGSGIELTLSTGNTFGHVTANSNSGGVNDAGVRLQNACHNTTFASITANGNKYFNFYLYSTVTNNVTIYGDLNISNSQLSSGAEIKGNAHVIGNVIANNNAVEGLHLLNATTNSTFGNVTANSNGKNGLLIVSSTGNTFGNVITNSNSSAGGVNEAGVRIQNSSHNNSFSSVTANNNKYFNFYLYSTTSNNITIAGDLNISNSQLSSGAEFKGDGHAVGNIVANNNALEGVSLVNPTTNSNFGNIEASANGKNGLLVITSTGNTFGHVVANSNSSAGGINEAGVRIQTSAHNNTFESITANNNKYYNFYMYSTASNNIRVNGTLQSSYSQLSDGTIINGSGQVFNDIISNNNYAAGIIISASSNSSFGRLVANGNGFGEAGVKLTGANSNLTFKSITANNNLGNGFWNYNGALQGLVIRDYLLTNNNLNGTLWASTATHVQISNITSVNNLLSGFETSGGSNGILRNVVTTNNGANGLRLASTTNYTIANIASSNNGASGITLATVTTAAFHGTVIVGNNSTANCTVTAGTNPGLTTTTCTTAGTDGSSAYAAGHVSTAVLRTNRTLVDSFVGFKGAPGDTANPDDGAAGYGSGVATWTATIDMFNFDNIFKSWGNPGEGTSGLHSSQQGSGTRNNPLKIYDWSLASSDTALLNRSGNGLTINNGSNLTTDGTEVAPDNSFSTIGNCPVQVFGNRSVESRPYAFSVLSNYPAGTTGFKVAGSAVTCASGDTACVKRFLINATEINDDNIGNDDGLCENGEVCVYSPNFGAYQGHLPSNDPYPLVHSSHQCTWQQNSGMIQNVQMYGYPKNGR